MTISAGSQAPVNDYSARSHTGRGLNTHSTDDCIISDLTSCYMTTIISAPLVPLPRMPRHDLLLFPSLLDFFVSRSGDRIRKSSREASLTESDDSRGRGSAACIPNGTSILA